MRHPQKKKKKKKPGTQSSWAARGGFVRFGRPQLKEIGGTVSRSLGRNPKGMPVIAGQGKGPAGKPGRAYLKYSTLESLL